MKTLHDGTEVEDHVPTKNVSGERYLLTEEEIAERTAAQEAEQPKRIANAIGDYREEVGQGAVTFQGITANGDAKTRSAIAETVQFWKELDPEDAPDTIDWQTADGSFSEISLSTLVGLGKKIGFQRQKTFSVKKYVLSKIEDGTLTTIEQAKATFDAAMEA